ncbi:hypothetical protein FSS13T_26200 [Flavobacterium saliperosum S13]|uniref:Uncharacterized protein n=1 Tax=Flavobacterium saliperosum S13 TaxID=1341155 RepID=A0ABN0QDK9_9FLAO|nr:hypothetical protein FSS13T_26200 [Flavobacterium saliperosum S13]
MIYSSNLVQLFFTQKALMIYFSEDYIFSTKRLKKQINYPKIIKKPPEGGLKK